MQTVQQITEEAINRVKENNKEDFNKILAFAEIWVKTQFKAFTSENLKSCYYLCGATEPIEPRVYGAIFRKMSKDGLIFKHGFEISKNPTCHSRPQQIWISREFKDKQKNNRKQDKSLNLFQSL